MFYFKLIPFVTIIFVWLKIDFLHQNSYLNLSAKHPVVLPSFFYTFPTEHNILLLSKLSDSIWMAKLFATHLFTTSNIFEYELGIRTEYSLIKFMKLLQLYKCINSYLKRKTPFMDSKLLSIRFSLIGSWLMWKDISKECWRRRVSIPVPLAC